MTETEISWVAGLLEGEGCFSRHIRKSNGHVCYAIHCEMSDEDVIQKLHNITKLGSVVKRLNIAGRSDKRVRKPTWIWSVQNKEGIRTILLAIVPYMCGRRVNKIKLMLGELLENI